MTHTIQRAAIVYMTNKSRALLYKKAAKEFASTLSFSVVKEIFIDTSWIEESLKGKQILTNVLSELDRSTINYSFIIIKDIKWQPAANKIRSYFKNNHLYIAEIDLKTVERFAQEMNPGGLIKHIHQQLQNIGEN